MTETCIWIDPDGLETTLDVQWNVAGRFMPKLIFESDGVPGQPGEYFREARHGLMEFSMPFDVVGTSEADLRSKVRALVASMDPTRGFGRLQVTSPAGDVREIICHVSSGLELVETLGELSGPTWQRFPVTFLAHDPYWYDPSPTQQDFAATTNVVTFFPILPIKLTASEVAVDTYVTNNGDVEAWPMWTITGPGGAVILRNLTTGKVLDFSSINLGVGQQIFIDTRPGRKTATMAASGDNMYPFLSATSSMWPLERGINTIRLEMSGVDITVSKLQLSFYQRYLSP